MSLLILVTLLQASREVIHDDRPVTLRVPVSAEGRHRASVITFPEEDLEALVAGWNEDELSVERRGERLFLKLLKAASGDVHVVGASGAVYRLSIQPAEDEYDGEVRILSPRDKKEGLPAPLKLLRAMRRGRRPDKGTVLSADERFHIPTSLDARITLVYEADAYRGFGIRIGNICRVPQRLDPSRFTGRDLVAAGAREMLLKPDEVTLLYLVFWKRP